MLFLRKDPAVISERLSSELASCKYWLIDNKLSLHVGKTESLLFGSKRKLNKVSSFCIYCDGVPVERVYKVKYLGVNLNSDLDGSFHALTVLKASAGRLAFLYRQSNLLSRDLRQTLCASLIQPYIDNCCSSWYTGLSCNLKGRLDVLQRKMVRYVNGLDFRSHVDNTHLHALSWLSVPDRVSYFKLMHVFRVRHNLAPAYLRPNFTSLTCTHSHNTRGSDLNYRLSHEVSIAPNSFAFSAAKQWNALPNYLKNISHFGTFKRKVKEYFLAQYVS